MRRYVLAMFWVHVVVAAVHLGAIAQGVYPRTVTTTVAGAAALVALSLLWSALLAWLLWG